VKLSGIREAYEELSGKLSNIVRQLAFAGIGIIWIFRMNNLNNSISISKELSWPLILLVATLFLDALQYLISTTIWHLFYYKNHKKDSNEDREAHENESWNIPCWIIFYSKVVVLMAAYVLLFIYLWRVLF
jgi:heme/copper-type cytochrome/quinol oxidase subunit 2